MEDRFLNFNILEGKIFKEVYRSSSDEEIHFITESGEHYVQYHEQDCCESVSIEDICGDLTDLIGAPILVAEEVSSHEDPADINKEDRYRESYTWTFYKLVTSKGYVTIRWYGESNGYYSESADLKRIA